MTTSRQRPTKDQEQNRVVDSLDELEQATSRLRGADFRPQTRRVSKLDWADKEEGFFYRWFSGAETSNDTPHLALQTGYEFVRHKNDLEKGQKVVYNYRGTDNYLMRIKNEHKEAADALVEKELRRKTGQLNEMSSEREYGATAKGQAVQQEIERSSAQLL